MKHVIAFVAGIAVALAALAAFPFYPVLPRPPAAEAYQSSITCYLGGGDSATLHSIDKHLERIEENTASPLRRKR